MVPTHERFDPHDPGRRQFDDRLVVDLKLFVVDGVAQLADKSKPIEIWLIAFGVVDRDTTAATWTHLRRVDDKKVTLPLSKDNWHFGVRAVDLVAEGRFDRMVVWQNRRVVDVPIEDTIATHRRVDVDGDLVKTARGLGVCFGDE